ncbi:MAG: integrase [Lautropia sp.]|nr:MAG: integrase [Pseudomonadota bacterium]MBC6958776.1 integrase [Lautropia sp.]MDL1907788.1 integrase [Betaproteobacteria bacterium PRO1]RIK89393.1 MAG: integrase [Burkholderiales bacterium]
MAKHSITTVKGREALKSRHAPYWHRISKGAYLGFQKTSATAPGTWVARFHDDEGRQTRHALGGFGDLPPSDRFDAAKAAAEEWFTHKGRGGTSEARTVRDVCGAYVQHLRDEGRENTAKDAEGRFRRWVYSDAKLAATPVMKLTAKQVDDWRKKLRKTLAIPQDKAKPATKPRTDSSLNRDMAVLKAALNLAVENGDATSDHAWKVKLKPVKAADNRRDVYLDSRQRKALIEAAPADLANLLRALCLLPLRPGAVAALNAGSFDKRLSTLVVGKDKAGNDRRIALPPATAAFFAALAKNKLPAAPLLTRADGKRWDKDAWKYPIKDAVKAAKLPATATAYSLRHSTITDLIALHRLPTLTVAQLSGTSVAMIERHYGHLLQDQAREALAGLAL